jgi:AAA domain
MPERDDKAQRAFLADPARKAALRARYPSPEQVKEILGSGQVAGPTSRPKAALGDGDVLAATGARPLSVVDHAPPPPLILGRLDPEGHTILYGTGDVGKGVEASRIIAELTLLGERVLIVDYEGHDREWARRVRGHGGDPGLVTIVQPASPEWTLGYGAIWQQAEALSRLRAQAGAEYVVIDSVVAACGGTDPSDPAAPGLYGQALQLIGGLPLSLAHITKAAGDSLRYPFGSVFWHNFARTTWSMSRDEDGRVRLEHRKLGNRESMGAFEVRFAFDDASGDIATVIEEWGGDSGLGQKGEDELSLIPAEGATFEELRAIWSDSDKPLSLATVKRRIATYQATHRVVVKREPKAAGGFRNVVRRASRMRREGSTWVLG